jgi:hypothetical protein
MGATIGGAWVAIVLSLRGESFGLLFGVCSAVAVAGLAGTFIARAGLSKNP